MPSYGLGLFLRFSSRSDTLPPSPDGGGRRGGRRGRRRKRRRRGKKKREEEARKRRDKERKRRYEERREERRENLALRRALVRNLADRVSSLETELVQQDQVISRQADAVRSLEGQVQTLQHRLDFPPGRAPGGSGEELVAETAPVIGGSSPLAGNQGASSRTDPGWWSHWLME